ncbi:MAG: type II secretion system protein GspG [Planctomycetota bacterium]
MFRYRPPEYQAFAQPIAGSSEFSVEPLPPRASRWPRIAAFIAAVAWVVANVAVWVIGLIADPGHTGNRFAVARAQVRTFGDAIERYRLRMDGLSPNASPLPATLQELIDGPPGFQGEWSNLLASDQLPRDPWGRPYQYVVINQSEGAYIVRSLGADGRVGGRLPQDADICYPPAPPAGDGPPRR